MRKIPTALTLSLATALGLGAPSLGRPLAVDAPTPVAASIPGPGAVFTSVQHLLRAIDAQDTEQLRSVLAPLGRGDGWQWTRNQEGELVGGAPDDADKGVLFADLARDGTAVTAATLEDAVTTLRDRVGGGDLQTHLTAVRADCASEHCSWASVEFERMITKEGGQRVLVPMRATALMRYHSEAPTMRIYAWHASATGPEQLLKGGRQAR